MRIDCPICKKVIALGTEICPHCGLNTMEETLDYTERGESTKVLEDRVYIASLVLILYMELYWVFIGGFMDLISNLMKNPAHPFVMSLGWWLSLAGLVLIGILNVSWHKSWRPQKITYSISPFKQFSYWFNFLRIVAPFSLLPFALFLLLNTVSVAIFFLMLSQYPHGHGMALSAIAIPGLALIYLIAQVGIKVFGGLTLLIDLIRICISSIQKEISTSFHPLALLFLPGMLLTVFMYGFILFREIRILSGF